MGEKYKSLVYFAASLACLYITFSQLTETGIMGLGIGLFGLILLERGIYVFRGLKPRQ